MGPQTYEPTFFLLKRRLPPSESANLLGRVIRRYQDPTLAYTPESPTEALTPQQFTTFLLPAQHDHSAHFTTQTTHDTTRYLKFISLLSTTSTSSGATTVTSPRITTRRLKREQAYFDTLKTIPHIRREILDLCPVNDKVYLVVGTMSVQTGSFDTTTFDSHKRSTGVALPLALAASAAAMGLGGVPLGPLGAAEVIPDAEAGVERASSAVSTASFRSDAGEGEEEVFAVACKVIRRSWGGLGRDVGVRERQPEYRRGRHFGVGDGDDSEGDGSGDEDGGEVDEEVEAAIAQGLVLGDEELEVGVDGVFNPYEDAKRGYGLDGNIYGGEMV